jgi:hypothetical protein
MLKRRIDSALSVPSSPGERFPVQTKRRASCSAREIEIVHFLDNQKLHAFCFHPFSELPVAFSYLFGGV